MRSPDPSPLRRLRSRFRGRPTRAASLGLGLALLLTGTAGAQQIGAAATTKNDVSRVRGAQRDALSAGEAVFRDEAVQTGADSLARIALNQYVYSEERPAGRVALNLLKGTYRFVTGDLDKRAYQINTPVATIGVRGTTFDVATTGARTVVTLLEGIVRVCTRAAPVTCVTLGQSGQSAVVTAGAASLVPGGAGERYAFSGYCAGNPGLCTVTRLGEGAAPPTAFAALCGR